MPRRYYSSIAVRTTLSSSISNSATSITVAAVTGFPGSYPYTLIIDEDTADQEVVEVTAGAGTTLTVTRGVDGTTAVAHDAGSAVNHGVSARDYSEPNEFVNTTGIELQQFAADGSVLQNLPARIHPAERLLKQSVLWLDAAHDTAGEQTIQNLGWGGSVLNAQSGSTGSADSNDPKYLEWDGENYVYLPGVTGNYLSVPDEAALDITGDIDIRVRLAMDDWTPGADSYLASKLSTSGNYSWRLGILTTGVVNFVWSANGSAVNSRNSTAGTAVVDGGIKWVRVTLDVDNGASGHDVKFFLSDDGTTWTQLGTTVTTAGATSIFSGNSQVEVGSFNGGGGPIAAKIYRAQVLNGIDGTPVLDVDCSQIVSGSDTTFTALTGQTVTINRSTAGRKAVAVVSPVWLFGTDDFIEVADNALLNFGATDSFTVLAVVRQWGDAAFAPTVFKRSATNPADVGWGIFANTGPVIDGGYSDGTNVPDVPLITHVLSQLTTFGVIRTSGVTLQAFRNGTLGSTVVDSSGNLSNSLPLRIGRISGAGTTYGAIELVAVAVFRRALTPTEITTISNYYTGRIG